MTHAPQRREWSFQPDRAVPSLSTVLRYSHDFHVRVRKDTESEEVLQIKRLSTGNIFDIAVFFSIRPPANDGNIPGFR